MLTVAAKFNWDSEVTEKTVPLNFGSALGLTFSLGSISWNERVLINGTVIAYLAGHQREPKLHLRKLGARFADTFEAGIFDEAHIAETIAIAYGYALGVLHASRADGTDVPMREVAEMDARGIAPLR